MRHFFCFFMASLFLVFFFKCDGKEKNKHCEAALTPWGVDTELLRDTSSAPPEKQLSSLQKGCCTLIRGFQIYISCVDGPRSHFFPTSSQYTLQAIQKYGALQGIVLGCDRLMRENSDPWIYPITLEAGVPRKFDPVR